MVFNPNQNYNIKLIDRTYPLFIGGEEKGEEIIKGQLLNITVDEFPISKDGKTLLKCSTAEKTMTIDIETIEKILPSNQQKEKKQGYPLFYQMGVGFTDEEIKNMTLEEVKILISLQDIKGDMVEIALVYDENHSLLEYAEYIAFEMGVKKD